MDENSIYRRCVVRRGNHYALETTALDEKSKERLHLAASYLNSPTDGMCIDFDDYDGPDRDPILYSRCRVHRRMRVSSRPAR
jgi:hypothetical protein